MRTRRRALLNASSVRALSTARRMLAPTELPPELLDAEKYDVQWPLQRLHTSEGSEERLAECSTHPRHESQ